MEWHDFYLTVGGVSGALVGLLFVAMSLRARELGGTSLLGASKQALLALVIALVVSLLMLAPPRAAPLVAIVLVLGGMAMVPGSVAGQTAVARRRLTPAFVAEALGFDLSCLGLLAGGVFKLAGLWLSAAELVIACAVIVLILLAISRSWRLATGKPPSVVFATSHGIPARDEPVPDLATPR